MLPDTIKIPAILALLAAPLAASPAAAAYDEGGNRAFMNEQFNRAEAAARAGRPTMTAFGVPQFTVVDELPATPSRRFARGGRPGDRAGSPGLRAPVESFVGGSFTRGARPGNRAAERR